MKISPFDTHNIEHLYPDKNIRQSVNQSWISVRKQWDLPEIIPDSVMPTSQPQGWFSWWKSSHSFYTPPPQPLNTFNLEMVSIRKFCGANLSFKMQNSSIEHTFAHYASNTSCKARLLRRLSVSRRLVSTVCEQYI